ncbi:transcriptional regulator, XRE family protein [Pseudomaricurvus alkylphenolicus]|uniref:transcriptional regulator, XRE family protein n=1 Tax=Pseudomaricurvus alkylphenolicus TaxID=1306991 RepID=UPI0014228408|nr:transcriptional regulator, XRE family protein [Pseudomaricurvus alkylphenolicus]NIB38813.1 transcriptional regulator, XRE family protein [Pseudomaricurvus alkylphenolicus]
MDIDLSSKTDQEVIEFLGQQFDILRRTKAIQDQELLERGGAHAESLNKFRQGTGNPTLKTLIRLLRGIGELDRLEVLMRAPEPDFRPSGQAVKPLPKRIKKPVKPTKPIMDWKSK